jgi:phage FluMu protein Com
MEGSERPGAAAEVRCHCGSLMARLVADRLELKCRRCKRLVVIAGPRAQRSWVAIPPHGEDR